MKPLDASRKWRNTEDTEQSFDVDERYRAAVQEGIAQADKGEFIEEQEMDTRFEAMLRETND